MIRAGICNTDLELVRGYMGFRGVLGHEFVGEALDGKLAGRRVVGGINFGCGRCSSCDREHSRHCAERRVLGILSADGAMAEEFLVPERNLHAVPPAMLDDVAVFTEPVSAACEILDQLGADFPRCTALVLGAGKLGLLVAQVLAADGFQVTLVARTPGGLDWLAERGIELLSEPPTDRKFRVVVEATGSAAGLGLAAAATEPRGTLVLKTTVAQTHAVDLAPIVINEITVVGSRCGRVESGLAALDAGRVDPLPMIDGRFPLHRAEEAFARAAAKGVRKVLLEGP